MNISKVIGKTSDVYNSFVESISTKIESFVYSYIFVIVYKVLIDIIYCTCIAETHAFFYLNVSVMNIINGWMAVLIFAVCFHYYYKQKSTSAIIIIIINMFYFIPITTYCGYGGGSSTFLLCVIAYWVCMSILQLKLPIFRHVRKKENSFNEKFFYILLALVSLLVLYIWGKYSDFRIWLNFIDVYDLRRMAENYEMPVFLSYLNSVSRIVIPMLILLFLNQKKYLWVIWLLFLTLLNFSYEGSKTVILFPLLLVGGYVFYRKNMINMIVPLGIFVELFAIFEQHFGTGLINSLVFRRQGMVIASLSDCYYRFFLENPIDLFRQGIMGKLGFESIYSQAISHVIGNNYFTQAVNCNNGLMADVFTGIGFLGVIIMPIILIICFRLFDFVSMGVDIRLVVSLAVYYSVIFMNSQWSTVLFSHGFIIMCLVLLVFPVGKEFQEEKLL